ncbi:putative capsule polysaccharide biosynthesis protein [Lasiosphaeria hispida]|uniref:Capsule polysaccharide biosynthesis protein n=1 Tax=Lasiosphaeria hispida TaxID=260671 RepID=A0AAJ0HBR2_9PEZI|nr:putative capsule polysaccharide biosynthesis protein [Lasiosphaeria hispida]
MTFNIDPGNLEDLCRVPDDDIDTRPDDEIAQQLRQYCPPTESEKNVWAYWHSGFDGMPPWVQRNVVNWVRRLGPSWTVRIVDSVGSSPMNALRFVDAQFFPLAFRSATMKGRWRGAHSGDLVRLPLLQLYGGVWMDAGMILIRHLDDIWNTLKDPLTPFELAGMALRLRGPGDDDTMMNSFFAAPRGNEYITRWHRIFLSTWAGRTQCEGIHAHPLLRHLKPFFPPPAEGRAPNIKTTPADMSDYLAHMLCGERLRNLIDPSDGFNGREYYENKIYLLSGLREYYYFELQNRWDAQRQFDLLSTPYDVDPEAQDEQFYAARDMVHDMLRNTAMIKLSHRPHESPRPWLADLWDDAQSHEADNKPGTFAFYLRQNIPRYNQTRPLKTSAVGRLKEKVWNVGVLEPIEDASGEVIAVVES